MAEYWSDRLKYHEDTVEKHKISEEELQFLRELQTELNTQDTICQADPRFWVIKGTVKEYGIEDGYEDGTEFVDSDNDIVAETMEEMAEYIKDNLLEDINSSHRYEVSLEIEDGCITIRDEQRDMDIYLDTPEEVIDWLVEMKHYNYRLCNYRNVGKIYEDTMFLTQKDAEAHLRANHYHYSEDAHTFAMTAWRSPRVEKLIKILQQVKL